MKEIFLFAILFFITTTTYADRTGSSSEYIRKISTHDIKWLSRIAGDKCGDLGKAIYKDIKVGSSYYFKDLFKNKTKRVQITSVFARLSTFKYSKKNINDVVFKASDHLKSHQDNVIFPNEIVPITINSKPFQVDKEPDEYFKDKLKANIVIEYKARMKYRSDIDNKIHEKTRLKCVLYRIVPRNNNSNNLEYHYSTF